jgi:hypothetical protein
VPEIQRFDASPWCVCVSAHATHNSFFAFQRTIDSTGQKKWGSYLCPLSNAPWQYTNAENQVAIASAGEIRRIILAMMNREVVQAKGPDSCTSMVILDYMPNMTVEQEVDIYFNEMSTQEFDLTTKLTHFTEDALHLVTSYGRTGT